MRMDAIMIHRSGPHDESKTDDAGQDSGLPSASDDNECVEVGDGSQLTAISTGRLRKTVQPFLQAHIPDIYTTTMKADQPVTYSPLNPNSKYCYRHKPDAKCQQAADEHTMMQVQRDLEQLPSGDGQAITYIWSLFSAAPSKHRELILQGIIAQSCFPQLSLVSREVHQLLKIDFISALPAELSHKILRFLDAVSLCRAAQVNRRWRHLADDDALWRRMCEQHICRKCEKCGLALPLLDNKLRSHGPQKREATTEESHTTKRRCIELAYNSNGPSSCKRTEDGSKAESDVGLEPENDQQKEQPRRRFRPWKEVYKDRFKVGFNWKHGRYSFEAFSGHSNGVTCLQFDDDILATGSFDQTIKIWDLLTGALLRTLRGHQRGVRTLRFDKHKLISGGLDNTLKVWNWRTGEELCTLSHDDAVIGVDLKGDMVASGSMDTTVHIWNFQTQKLFRLRGHNACVNQVRLDLPSRTILSASDDALVKMWDLDSKTCIKTYAGHVSAVQTVLALPLGFEPDDRVNDDGADIDGDESAHGRGATPALSTSSAGAEPSRREAEEDDDDLRERYGPAFQSDPARPLPPRYIVTGGLDTSLRLWDTATGRCLRTMLGHIQGVRSLEGDALRVVTGGQDGMTKIWDPRSGRCERTFTGHRGPVLCVGLSDTRLASGGGDGEVRLYNFGQDVET